MKFWPPIRLQIREEEAEVDEKYSPEWINGRKAAAFHNRKNQADPVKAFNENNYKLMLIF